jgi:D-beta-D-heptose 7-phosphate kinase/D-beta-D-heptose 1-phosphate adenosyltransferase
MLDRSMRGESVRQAPERPVPVVWVTEEKTTLGGAGNVVANLRGLGVSTKPVGVVGDDGTATVLRTLLAELRCGVEGLVVAGGRPTTEKRRIYAAQQLLVRVDRESTAPLPVEAARQMRQKLRETLNGADLLVISDYAKGACPPPAVREVTDLAIHSGIPVLVDPKGGSLGQYRGATLLKPNWEDLRDDRPDPAAWNSSADQACQNLRVRLGLGTSCSPGERRGCFTRGRVVPYIILRVREPSVRCAVPAIQ